MRIHGILFDGQTSSSHQAALVTFGDFVELIWGDENKAQYSIADINVHERLGSTPQVVELGYYRFETREFDKVEKFLNQRTGLIHRLEENWKAVAAGTITTVAFLVFIYFQGLPWLGEISARYMTRDVDKYLQDSTLEAFEQLGVVEIAEKFQDELRDLEGRLNALPEIKEMEIEIIVLEGKSLGANAIALPYNKVFITDKLFEVATHQDQLFAVVLHEVGHIKQRHGLQLMIQKSAIGMLLFFIFEDMDFSSIPTLLLNNSYSRDHERSADLFAADILKELDIKPSVLGEILIKMTEYKSEDEADSTFGFLSTHPLTEERMKYLNELSN